MGKCRLTWDGCWDYGLKFPMLLMRLMGISVGMYWSFPILSFGMQTYAMGMHDLLTQPLVGKIIHDMGDKNILPIRPFLLR